MGVNKGFVFRCWVKGLFKDLELFQGAHCKRHLRVKKNMGDYSLNCFYFVVKGGQEHI